MRRYQCQRRDRLQHDHYSIEAVQPEHLETIRQWRNAQMDVLRQKAPISVAQQDQYYATRIWPDMEQPHPANLLVSYFENNYRIGYGGLVHIEWEYLRAEVSFLLDPVRANDPDGYRNDFSAFLGLIQELAFDELGLNRLFTETYAIRTHHISILEESGFRLEGVLKEHMFIAGKPVNCLIHGRLRSEAKSDLAGASLSV